MKLIYISKYASYAPYGLETRHFYIAREMAKHGYDPTVYLSTSNHNLAYLPKVLEDSVGDVAVQWIPTLQYKKVYGLRRIASWFHFELRLRKKLSILHLSSEDVVVCSSLSLLSVLAGIRLKRKWKCKLIFEVRDIWPLVLTRLMRMAKWNPIYVILRYIEVKGYKNANIVVGTMPNLAEHVEQSIGESKKTLWIPHLVNDKITYSTTHRYVKQLALIKKENKKIICYAGSINKSSALTYLLDAALHFYATSTDVSVVLLGTGPCLADLKATYTSPNIHFFDKIPQQEVVAFCKDCDILYDGYLRSELYRFGNSRNKYVEYCLAQKSILLAYEGHQHFVQEYNCGVVVAPESSQAIIDGVKSLLQKDTKTLLQMGENAFTFAQSVLSLPKQVNQLIQEINRV